jgi:hypothetical protein
MPNASAISERGKSTFFIDVLGLNKFYGNFLNY